MRKRRIASITLLGGLTMLWAIAFAVPAGAVITSGKCSGVALFSNGLIVPAEQPLDQVVAVPPTDTVDYTGTTGLDKPTEAVSFTGGISVRIPFTSVSIVTWSGETEENSASGLYTYEAPSSIPRGTGPMEVTATHTQQGQTCVATVQMTLEGDPGTAAYIAAGGTVIFGLGTFAAGMRKKGLL